MRGNDDTLNFRDAVLNLCLMDLPVVKQSGCLNEAIWKGPDSLLWYIPISEYNGLMAHMGYIIILIIVCNSLGTQQTVISSQGCGNWNSFPGNVLLIVIICLQFCFICSLIWYNAMDVKLQVQYNSNYRFLLYYITWFSACFGIPILYIFGFDHYCSLIRLNARAKTQHKS